MTGLGFNQLSFVGTMNGQHVAMSAVGTLSLGTVVLQTEDTTVYADQVTVNGEVRTEGHSLTIVCRRLEFAEGSRIVSSGKAAAKSYPPDLRPQSTHVFGQPGLSGDSGSAGFNAGDVTILAHEIVGEAWIQAIGGVGGRGQDGGHGADGAPGQDGVKVYISDRRTPAPGAYGGPGQPGGVGGLPGPSGPGGKFGSIDIQSSKVFSHRLEVLNGAPGAPSAGGKRGTGGRGGFGADVLNRVCESNFRDSLIGAPGAWDALHADLAARAWKENLIESQPAGKYDGRLLTASLWGFGHGGEGGGGINTKTCHDELWYHAGDGDPGVTPQDTPDATQIAIEVMPPGGGTQINIPFDSATVATRVDDYYFELLVCALENEFAESGTVPASEFIEKLNFAIYAGDIKLALSPIKKECAGRLLSMARKISLGLDYFGLSRSAVPLKGVKFYSGKVDTMLPYLEAIENSFQKYWESSDNAQAARETVNQALTQAKKQLAGVASETQRLIDDTTPLAAQLKGFDFQVAHCWEVLKQHEQELNAAITRLNNRGGCDLIQAVTCVGVIVASVYTGGTALAAGAGAAGKLFSDFNQSQDLWDDKYILGDDFEKIGDQTDKVADSIVKLQGAWTKLNARKPNIDLTTPPQFTMEKAQLDAVCDKYAGLGLKEADAYREAGYAYLKCVETRNDAIVDYNGLLLQLLSQFTKQSAGIRMIDELTTKLATSFDPSDAQVKCMMSRIYLDSLNSVAQMVYAEKKAINYHYARALDAPVSKFNHAMLAAEHIENLSIGQSADEAYRARREIFKLELDFKRICDAGALELFRKTGVLLFVVRREGFYEPILEGLSGFRITGIEVGLPGIVLKQGYSSVPWTMTQAGTEYVYKRNGSAVKFTHRQIEFQGATSTIGAASYLQSDFSADGMYAGVSPFAQWTLALNLNEKLGLDMTGLHDMQLVLTGYMVENL